MLKLIYFLVRSPKVCNTLRLPPDSHSRSYAVGESAIKKYVSILYIVNSECLLSCLLVKALAFLV